MHPLRTAEIIAVGSELLSPFRTDTNSLELTSRLNALGIVVAGKAVVGDEVGPLAELVRLALARVDLVVTTGGLGPTEDDVTRVAVARALGLELTEDPAILRSIEARFARRGLAMPAINRRQAMVIDGATVVANPAGTAPGLWVDIGDEKVVFLLPGPPRELRAILEADGGARLAARATGRRIERRVIRMTGRPESTVDEIAAPIYRPWRSATIPIETTILAAGGQIELHLSAAGDGSSELSASLDRAVRALSDALGEIVISTDGRPLESVVGDTLKARSWKVATAESCTGGGIATRLTDIPGSSAYLVGGIIAYDDAVKINTLGVPPELLSTHGAVSEPVALAMADGVRARLKAEVGLAVTGIAGPTGGSEAKPVGTVVVSLAMVDRPTRAHTFHFFGDRATIRTQSCVAALDMLRRALGRTGER